MAELKEKLVNLGGLDYFNKHVAQPHEESISSMAAAMFAMKEWIDDAEERLKNVENYSGSSAELASMFEIVMDDVYHISDESEAPTLIANSINVDGFAIPIGTSGVKWAKPVVQIPPINWPNEVDDNYDFTASGVVKVWFGQAGAISKTVTFKKPGPGKISAVRLSDTTAYIDTGIKGDYSYMYHTKGYTTSGNQCVFMDAFVSTTDRATVRVLGSANKLQTMFFQNREVLGSSADMTFTQPFEMTAGKNKLILAQSGKTYEASVTGHSGTGEIDANIRLLNSASGGLGNGVLHFAELLGANDETLAYYAPYKLEATGEIVMVNTYGMTAQQIYDIVENGNDAEMAERILRPSSGVLVEVT